MNANDACMPLFYLHMKILQIGHNLKYCHTRVHVQVSLARSLQYQCVCAYAFVYLLWGVYVCVSTHKYPRCLDLRAHTCTYLADRVLVYVCVNRCIQECFLCACMFACMHVCSYLLVCVHLPVRHIHANGYACCANFRERMYCVMQMGTCGLTWVISRVCMAAAGKSPNIYHCMHQ